MKDMPDILNWRRQSETRSLSGQPTEAQLAALAASGVTQIINLGPHDNDGALPDEAASCAALGLTYTYIPVDFAAPTEADYTAFRAALSATQGHHTHIHCLYNARVSAFFYRLARDTDQDVAAAQALMDGIWRPGGVWAHFIGKPQDAVLPNRYAGYEY